MFKERAGLRKAIQVRGLDLCIAGYTKGVVALFICRNEQDVWSISHGLSFRELELPPVYIMSLARKPDGVYDKR